MVLVAPMPGRMSQKAAGVVQHGQARMQIGGSGADRQGQIRRGRRFGFGRRPVAGGPGQVHGQVDVAAQRP